MVDGGGVDGGAATGVEGGGGGCEGAPSAGAEGAVGVASSAGGW